MWVFRSTSGSAISAISRSKKGKFVIRRINPILWRGMSKKENVVQCFALLTCFLVLDKLLNVYDFD